MTHAPLQLHPWLIHEQSLTQKLKSISGDARLEILDQRWETSDAWDSCKLKLNAIQVLHREIVMWAFDSPCWYARTILPDNTCKANKALFDRLNTEPLGQLIFNGTEIQRASLIHYPISSLSMEYQWLNPTLHQDASILWVRLSEFLIASNDSFFLVEILLPGLLSVTSRTPSRA